MPFFAGLRERLRDEGVDLALVHGFARDGRARRRDQGDLPWAVTTRNRHIPVLPGVQRAVWQPLPRDLLRGADLVVVEQASRHLLNYRLLARSRTRGRPRLVLWGHGRNLQAGGSLTARASERLKRLVSAHPHWWLAYTAGSADRVAAIGFPRERITVVQNAVAVRRPAESVERMPDRCVYVGSLYPDKRIDFLLEAARRTAELRPGFRLVVIGDGEDRALVERAAGSSDWLEYRGSIFGDETAVELRRSQLLLMPGLVGLAVVDAFAQECPMVTVDLPFHSPEIEYLEDDVNGVCLPAGTSPEQYGEEVSALLGDASRLDRLRAGCRDAAATYTVEAMVDHVAVGLLKALLDALALTVLRISPVEPTARTYPCPCWGAGPHLRGPRRVMATRHRFCPRFRDVDRAPAHAAGNGGALGGARPAFPVARVADPLVPGRQCVRLRRTDRGREPGWHRDLPRRHRGRGSPRGDRPDAGSAPAAVPGRAVDLDPPRPGRPAVLGTRRLCIRAGHRRQRGARPRSADRRNDVGLGADASARVREVTPSVDRPDRYRTDSGGDLPHHPTRDRSGRPDHPGERSAGHQPPVGGGAGPGPGAPRPGPDRSRTPPRASTPRARLLRIGRPVPAPLGVGGTGGRPRDAGTGLAAGARADPGRGLRRRCRPTDRLLGGVPSTPS